MTKAREVFIQHFQQPRATRFFIMRYKTYFPKRERTCSLFFIPSHLFILRYSLLLPVL